MFCPTIGKIKCKTIPCSITVKSGLGGDDLNPRPQQISKASDDYLK